MRAIVLMSSEPLSLVHCYNNLYQVKKQKIFPVGKKKLPLSLCLNFCNAFQWKDAPLSATCPVFFLTQSTGLLRPRSADHLSECNCRPINDKGKETVKMEMLIMSVFEPNCTVCRVEIITTQIRRQMHGEYFVLAQVGISGEQKLLLPLVS